MVLTAPWPEPIREPEEILLVDRVENSDHGTLEDFILQSGYTQRSLSAIRLRYEPPPNRLRPVAAAMDPAITWHVPGHGPLSDHAGLLRYRKVIGTIRDRVRSQKRAKKTLAQVQASKPSADFDATWGKGMMAPNDFVALVYNTL